MRTLDLHGIRHHQAELMIENFVLSNDLPLKVITGHSFTMQKMVKEITNKHEMSCFYENHLNLGSIIITDCVR